MRKAKNKKNSDKRTAMKGHLVDSAPPEEK